MNIEYFTRWILLKNKKRLREGHADTINDAFLRVKRDARKALDIMYRRIHDDIITQPRDFILRWADDFCRMKREWRASLLIAINNEAERIGESCRWALGIPDIKDKLFPA